MSEKELKAMDYVAGELSDIIGFLTITEEEEWNAWMKEHSTSFDHAMDKQIKELFSEE